MRCRAETSRNDPPASGRSDQARSALCAHEEAVSRDHAKSAPFAGVRPARAGHATSVMADMDEVRSNGRHRARQQQDSSLGASTRPRANDLGRLKLWSVTCLSIQSENSDVLDEGAGLGTHVSKPTFI